MIAEKVKCNTAHKKKAGAFADYLNRLVLK